jgi:isoleucyl-tRNA synthetase
MRSQFSSVEESVHLRSYPPAEPVTDEQCRLMEEMAIVREIASLGRAARMEAKLKVRQPLAVVELVLADPSHRQWLEGHLPLIADELNVKRIEFVTDADQYVTYQVKPNFKVIGPKFGKLAPKIKQALASADAAALRQQLECGGKAALTVEGEPVELTADDVQVTLEARPGWTASQGRHVVVVLSTELTAGLKSEGLARDLVHLIQTARKDERLDYQDRIRLRISATGSLAAAIEAHRNYICHETLAIDLALDSAVADAKHTGEIEGMPVRIAMEVVR